MKCSAYYLLLSVVNLKLYLECRIRDLNEVYAESSFLLPEAAP